MSYGTGKNARQGKIARLSDALRSELNQRLLDGQNGRQILDWLNAHPEVKTKCEESPEGLHITDQNLSNWRLGGFEEWRSRRERLERLKDLSQFSAQLAKNSGGNLTEGAAAILSGKILEQLEILDQVVSADDSKTPAAPNAELVIQSAAALAALAEALVPLRSGDHDIKRLGQNDEKLAISKQRTEQNQQYIDLAKRDFMRKYAADFSKWVDDARVREILSGADSTDAKTEKLGQTIFGEEWK